MTAYYVYPDDAGTDSGTLANPWKSIQSAFDNCVAGDIVYCRGKQTLSATLDLDTAGHGGTNAGGWIKYIGCKSDWTVDGTRFQIDANHGNYSVLTAATNSMDMMWFENFELFNAGDASHHTDGVTLNIATSGWVYINCTFHDNAGYGINGVSGRDRYAFYFRCAFYNNTYSGITSSSADACAYACRYYSNTVHGLYGVYGVYIGCLIYGNGDDGINIPSNSARFFHCVIDGNTDDGVALAGTSTTYGWIFLGCRITNQSGSGDCGISFNAGGDPCVLGYNYFGNNADDLLNDAAALTAEIPVVNGSTSSNLYGQSDTNQGYTAGSPYDYNLATTATYRRVPISIPLT